MDLLKAYSVMAYIVMAYIVIAYIVMAHIVMAYIVMAYMVMAYIVMACIVMAYGCGRFEGTRLRAGIHGRERRERAAVAREEGRRPVELLEVVRHLLPARVRRCVD